MSKKKKCPLCIDRPDCTQEDHDTEVRIKLKDDVDSAKGKLKKGSNQTVCRCYLKSLNAVGVGYTELKSSNANTDTDTSKTEEKD